MVVSRAGPRGFVLGGGGLKVEGLNRAAQAARGEAHERGFNPLSKEGGGSGRPLPNFF